MLKTNSILLHSAIRVFIFTMKKSLLLFLSNVPQNKNEGVTLFFLIISSLIYWILQYNEFIYYYTINKTVNTRTTEKNHMLKTK